VVTGVSGLSRRHQEGDGPYRHVTVIDPTTIRISRHAPGAPGSGFPDDDGEYNRWVTQGRVFGLGFSRNMPHAKIVRADLERLAAEIAG
jgi:hypothetical protein